jgi:autotransporter-associated beta strand protein
VIRNGTGAGVLSFTKSGAGALTLSNNDTYTGATNVDGGALIVSGSLSGSSSTTVINATLGGTGLISNAVTVGNGQGLTGSAMIEPATATTTGTLTTGALTLNSDAAYVFNLNSTAGAADEIVATSLSLNASAEFLASDIAATSTALAANTQFVVLQTSNPFTGTFVNLPDNSDITIGANTFLASYDTPDELTLTVVAIPEPGTYATLLSGIAMLAFWRRARRGLGGRFSKKLSI